jgi:hypothetical protein
MNLLWSLFLLKNLENAVSMTINFFAFIVSFKNVAQMKMEKLHFFAKYNVKSEYCK